MRFGPTGRSPPAWDTGLRLLVLFLTLFPLAVGIDVHTPGDLRNSQRYIDQTPCSEESWSGKWGNFPDEGVCSFASVPSPADTCPANPLCTTFIPDARSTWIDQYMPFVPLPLETNVTASSAYETFCRMRIRAADSNGNPIILRTIWETDDTSVAPRQVTGDFVHLHSRGLGAFTAGFPYEESPKYWDAVVIPTGTVASGKSNGWPEGNALPLDRYEEVFGGAGIAMQFPSGVPSHIVVSTRGARIPGTFYCRDGLERRGNATIPGLEHLAYFVLPRGDMPLTRYGPLFSKNMP
ncbi:hypothetical protein A1Q1_00630 [Trichosporon asahii var. asahii CBS 2479]|uniref:Uncharacterized protein n=1 Tax=Trichosporon asahii var. asahii (strain ATCC 90039 / CBS 2479 / JCM 2466 / KCTC 7840 / NBRC 103889/ NCYC 2677 / UAMH 7654) TaxID=1186058 RepID=J5R141_TRIAS|nr:hypothetical protein A1Q1_00630 [Trichosporon asahii var. asahii CBS 2479]EJT50163.1 hypothetical protein A1Q1_00630 [Trichosporon asahii var. asahii CBS 2479]